MLGVYTRGGTVLTVGSTDWAHGLRGGDPVVERITQNVMDRPSEVIEEGPMADRLLRTHRRRSSLALVSATGLVRAEGPNLRIAPGFRVTQYSDEALANDIQAMALDRHGRVVVTGPAM